jgi:hypothetical protein
MKLSFVCTLKPTPLRARDGSKGSVSGQALAGRRGRDVHARRCAHRFEYWNILPTRSKSVRFSSQ